MVKFSYKKLAYFLCSQCVVNLTPWPTLDVNFQKMNAYAEVRVGNGIFLSEKITQIKTKIGVLRLSWGAVNHESSQIINNLANFLFSRIPWDLCSGLML